MASEMPKQYLDLLGKPMIYHTINRLCDCPQIRKVFVILSSKDTYWSSFPFQEISNKLEPLYCGGETRADSVRNGLTEIAHQVDKNDWILVHDAARPCINIEDVGRLIREVGEDDAGGILAVPVADTIKRGNAEGRISATEPREHLWRAQTPQMFRHGLLLKALSDAREMAPTDEARAMERMGYHPKLVLGDNNNLKVTYPEDLKMASMILSTGLAEGQDNQ